MVGPGLFILCAVFPLLSRADVTETTFAASNGAPIAQPYAWSRAGPSGPLLLQDFPSMDLLAHFARERIPERVVHAKGAGAHGYFEVTHDMSNITSSKFLSSPGTRANVTVRFSTVGGELGSADTARDPRGFSTKIRTDEGNWDWVFNDTPVFFIRDGAKFPHFIHTQKRNPQTHLKDADMFWDYLSLNPESILQVMYLFSDRGTPDGFHNMHGYSGHTYKWTKSDGTFYYVQTTILRDTGFKTLDRVTAGTLAGTNPDYGTQTLFEAIEAGDYPTYTVYIQTMTPEQAEGFRYNILDLTKVWPQNIYPLQEIGKLVLNKNPENYFAEIEQLSFAPANMIPYIEPSADPVLQARMFSYPDTARHRLGPNFNQLPINCPLFEPANFQRDGWGTIFSQGSRPNYQSSIQPLTYQANPGWIYGEGCAGGEACDYERRRNHENFLGAAYRDLSEFTELDLEQPRGLWAYIWNDTQRAATVGNLAAHMANIKNVTIANRQLSIFTAVNKTFGDSVASALGLPTVDPLVVKNISEAVKFRAYIGYSLNVSVIEGTSNLQEIAYDDYYRD
ncbi:catalase [Armillaria novae-zelandiae]|uniref:Catalase n=1 Tax=Armillaria novae-zelandiae TaxID=153914 RepID=A0AA39PH39_9AGAR|nr:catalase [Armillaria novae-zelandiae]